MSVSAITVTSKLSKVSTVVFDGKSNMLNATPMSAADRYGAAIEIMLKINFVSFTGRTKKREYAIQAHAKKARKIASIKGELCIVKIPNIRGQAMKSVKDALITVTILMAESCNSEKVFSNKPNSIKITE